MYFLIEFNNKKAQTHTVGLIFPLNWNKSEAVALHQSHTGVSSIEAKFIWQCDAVKDVILHNPPHRNDSIPFIFNAAGEAVRDTWLKASYFQPLLSTASDFNPSG